MKLRRSMFPRCYSAMSSMTFFCVVSALLSSLRNVVPPSLDFGVASRRQGVR